MKVKEPVIEVRMFSASDLIKKSAKQLVFFKHRKERQQATYGQIKGEAFQKKIVESKGAASELRGIFKRDDVIIFFCNDMYEEKSKTFTEIKSVDPERDCPDWYFESSLVQTAFYKSLLMRSDGNMSTPSFRVKDGYDKIHVNVSTKSKYNLLFGKDLYSIIVKNPDKIIQYYLDKIDSLDNYDSAGFYDAIYKFQDFKKLSKYFKFKKIRR